MHDSEVVQNHQVTCLPLKTNSARPVGHPDVLEYFRFDVGPVAIRSMCVVHLVMVKGHSFEHWQWFDIRNVMCISLVKPHLCSRYWVESNGREVVPVLKTVILIIPFVGITSLFEKLLNILKHTKSNRFQFNSVNFCKNRSFTQNSSLVNHFVFDGSTSRKNML